MGRLIVQEIELVAILCRKIQLDIIVVDHANFPLRMSNLILQRAPVAVGVSPIVLRYEFAK